MHIEQSEGKPFYSENCRVIISYYAKEKNMCVNIILSLLPAFILLLTFILRMLSFIVHRYLFVAIYYILV